MTLETGGRRGATPGRGGMSIVVFTEFGKLFIRVRNTISIRKHASARGHQQGSGNLSKEF